jgi:hypothetical protein
VEFTGKRVFDGFKLAAGPQLWWGANPSVMAKYRRWLGPFDMAAVYQEDIARLAVSSVTSSIAIPLPPTRKATLSAATSWRRMGFQVGAIWSGSTKVGTPFQVFDNGRAFRDVVRTSDAFGGKAKVTFSAGRYNWYAQAASMGPVADGGPTAVQTFTGWQLTDTGLSDQWNVMTGVAARFGYLEIAPNVLYQKPWIGPIPAYVAAPGRPRNIIDDPFVVRSNREMAAAELLLTYDPTPGTWMYMWDNDLREDARFAGNLGFVFRHYPTTQDAAIGFLADGRTPFAFPGATPARDLWEVRTRLVTRASSLTRLIANLYAGTAEPNGNDQRLLHRAGGDVRVVRGHVKLMGAVKVNDWGPYDYYRDFNLTFPQQYIADAGYVLGRPHWLDLPETRIGLRGTLRALDKYSPRYCPERVPDNQGVLTCDPTFPAPNGREWEIRSYLMFAW